MTSTKIALIIIDYINSFQLEIFQLHRSVGLPCNVQHIIENEVLERYATLETASNINMPTFLERLQIGIKERINEDCSMVSIILA
jgi:hypothetical protein